MIKKKILVITSKGFDISWKKELTSLFGNIIVFSSDRKSEIIKKGITTIKSGNYEYPITYKLIKDGKKNKILKKKIDAKIKVTMIHGQKDEVVPVKFSKMALSIFSNAIKKLIIIKNGDHSLSNTKQLKRIKKEFWAWVVYPTHFVHRGPL